MKKRLLVYGGSGAIAGAVREAFQEDGWSVIATSRSKRASAGKNLRWVTYDPFARSFDPAALDRYGPFNAVCWAQGANINDSIYDVDADRHISVYKANCLFNIVTLNSLLKRKLLAKNARLCVISSIWQTLSRQNKLSYSVSKSALQGFVLSTALDLGRDGYLINAILPGALDTPMTRRLLKPRQIKALESATFFNHLPGLADVSSLAVYLCSEQNRSITGQFVAVDLGFRHARIL